MPIVDLELLAMRVHALGGPDAIVAHRMLDRLVPEQPGNILLAVGEPM
jgi:hypothetical protein